MFVLAFASVVAVGKLQLVAIKMHLDVCERCLMYFCSKRLVNV